MAEFVISERALEHNARILREIGDRSGATVVLALKSFSTTACLPLVGRYADGCCASGVWEALLGCKHMGKKVAVYSPAYRDEEFSQLAEFAHHIDFNSFSQWERFREEGLTHPRARAGDLLFGLRINPQYSTGHTPIYDPCAPGSRLGIPREAFEGADMSGISGLHFHTLCEQGAEDLMATWDAVEKGFGDILMRPEIKYLNMGGGHWITKPDYNRNLLVDLVRKVREQYGVEVVLEPGEAWCIHSGVLRCRVLDVFESMGTMHAILDVSASAHMPDVLEMPYRPDVFQVVHGEQRVDACPAVTFEGESYELAGQATENRYTYRLGAPTCLAGDVIGDYSFPHALRAGDTLVFDDMAQYTLVKTTFFNGVPHPSVFVQESDGTLRCAKEWGYSDFEARLGEAEQV